MTLKKYIAYAVIAGCILGVGILISSKINLIPGAKAEIQKPGNLDPSFVQAKEKVNSIPLLKDQLLNANRNYSVLDGIISTTFEATGEKEVVEFTIEQPNRFYVKHTANSKTPDKFTEAVNNGSNIQIKGPDSKLKDLKPISNQTNKGTSEEITPDYNGTYLPIGGINELLHPEMFIQGAFSRGQVTIKGEESFLGRKSTVMIIDYKEGKLGNKQTFWIDNESGIILKLVTSDGDKPIQTIAFENILFSKSAQADKFKALK